MTIAIENRRLLPTGLQAGVAFSYFTMFLNLKTLTGATKPLEVDAGISINELKLVIKDLLDMAVEHQRIISKGKVLENDTMLADYGVEEGDTLHLVFYHRGGHTN